LISKKNSKPKPRYKTPKREWKQPRWRPQPKINNIVQMWIPKGVIQTMNELDYKILNVASHPYTSRIVKSFDPNEEIFKGPIYKWVPKPKT